MPGVAAAGREDAQLEVVLHDAAGKVGVAREQAEHAQGVVGTAAAHAGEGELGRGVAASRLVAGASDRVREVGGVLLARERDRARGRLAGPGGVRVRDRVTVAAEDVGHDARVAKGRGAGVGRDDVVGLGREGRDELGCASLGRASDHEDAALLGGGDVSDGGVGIGGASFGGGGVGGVGVVVEEREGELGVAVDEEGREGRDLLRRAVAVGAEEAGRAEAGAGRAPEGERGVLEDPGLGRGRAEALARHAPDVGIVLAADLAAGREDVLEVAADVLGAQDDLELGGRRGRGDDHGHAVGAQVVEEVEAAVEQVDVAQVGLAHVGLDRGLEVVG